MIAALLDSGASVLAIAPADKSVGELEGMGCEFTPLPIEAKGTSPVADLALLLRFQYILQRRRPAAFLGYTIKPNIYGSIAAQSLGIPTFNTISGLGAAFIETSWITRVAKSLYRIALWNSHTVFFQNEEDRSLFVSDKIVRRERTSLSAGSGVDLDRFRSVPFRAEAPNEVRFLLVARMLWDKGVGEYIEAARKIRTAMPHAKFQLLGATGVSNPAAIKRGVVESWVSEGIVEYLGLADDVRPLIAQADCIVLPSYREGLSRVLLEAAAMARPIIASDVPGCRNVVDNGVNGFLCAARDANDLMRTMLEFVRLDRNARIGMGTRGRAKVEREFDEQIVVRQYLRSLAPVLSRPQAFRQDRAELGIGQLRE